LNVFGFSLVLIVNLAAAISLPGLTFKYHTLGLHYSWLGYF